MDEVMNRFIHCEGCDTPTVCQQRGCGRSMREFAQSMPPCKCPDAGCLRHNSFAEHNRLARASARDFIV